MLMGQYPLIGNGRNGPENRRQGGAAQAWGQGASTAHLLYGLRLESVLKRLGI
jgi:hypothetical protein